jgi:hypothetical protein
MTTLRNRIKQLEEEQWRRLTEELDGYLAGRSVEDVEFFCVHGFLPEVPIRQHPGTLNTTRPTIPRL